MYVAKTELEYSRSTQMIERGFSLTVMEQLVMLRGKPHGECLERVEPRSC